MLGPDVIYEDLDVLVIDKPAGLTVHQDGRNKDKSLVDWIEEKYPDVKGVGEPYVNQESGIRNQDEVIVRSGIVHRLDKDSVDVELVANRGAVEMALFEPP